MTLRQKRDAIKWFLILGLIFVVILTLGAIGWLIPIMIFLVCAILVIFFLVLLAGGGFWLFTEDGYEMINETFSAIRKHMEKKNEQG